MFGIGTGEMVVIVILALLAVGPKRMPILMQSLGRAMREFRRASRDLQAQVGLDEIMRDDMDERIRERARTPAIRPRETVSTTETIAREYPEEGVDVAEERVRKAGAL
ncbi:MAG: twin-arginine translocase TatA/TatE family subunit [Sandaracinaceae bacterium]|nr:twin-arginine translocase TatA/TatE family subunit [Sandaracinaceae bacterium]